MNVIFIMLGHLGAFPADYLLGLTNDPRRPAKRDNEAVADGIDDLTERAIGVKRRLQGRAGTDDEP